eukprot:3619783-Heterocapsa_arctica.AAC.1
MRARSSSWTQAAQGVEASYLDVKRARLSSETQAAMELDLLDGERAKRALSSGTLSFGTQAAMELDLLDGER